MSGTYLWIKHTILYYNTIIKYNTLYNSAEEVQYIVPTLLRLVVGIFFFLEKHPQNSSLL